MWIKWNFLRILWIRGFRKLEIFWIKSSFFVQKLWVAYLLIFYFPNSWPKFNEQPKKSLSANEKIIPANLTVNFHKNQLSADFQSKIRKKILFNFFYTNSIDCEVSLMIFFTHFYPHKNVRVTLIESSLGRERSLPLFWQFIEWVDTFFTKRGAYYAWMFA